MTVTITGISAADWEDAQKKVLFLQPMGHYYEVKGGEQLGGKIFSFMVAIIVVQVFHWTPTEQAGFM